MPQFFQRVAELMGGGRPVALATLVEGQGSIPRAVGTQMAIGPGGATVATIGGGRLEAEVLRLAAEVLGTGCSRLMPFDMTHLDARGPDMICGGRGKVAIACLGPESLPAVRAAAGAEEGGAAAWVCTIWGEGEAGWEFQFREAEPGPSGEPGLVALPDGRHAFRSPIRGGGRVYLCGGGYVCTEIARIATYLDFSVTVMDDRADFADPGRFPGCRTLRLGEGAVPPPMPLGAGDYVLIATRGHQLDLASLRWALGTGAGFIGMIGSRRKRELIYGALREEGVTDAQLQGVHCPMGLPIEAQTPEEIAISVTAQLVQARARA